MEKINYTCYDINKNRDPGSITWRKTLTLTDLWRAKIERRYTRIPLLSQIHKNDILPCRIEGTIIVMRKNNLITSRTIGQS